MKPFAWLLTYRGAPTRAFADEADAHRELQRLNRQYRADQCARALMPVFTELQVAGMLASPVKRG